MKDRGQEIQPGQPVTIDRFQPGDAEGVARLFVSVYGEDYPVREYVDPELLRRANAAGRIISSVARTPKGEIVAHNALFNSAPYRGVFESGAGLVHERYRGGRGIFTRVVRHGEEWARQIPRVEVIFGEPVCHHVFSQKLTHGLGWKTMAVEVDLMPSTLYGKDAPACERVAAILDFKTIRSQKIQVFLPGAYAEILQSLYEGLDDVRILSTSGEAPPASQQTRIDSEYFAFAQVGRFAIWEMGRDFERVLSAREREAKGRGAKVLQAWVNIGIPGCGWAVEVLRNRGYFLGGILPRWFDNDGMLMTWTAQRPSWEGIQLQFDRAKVIAALVREDWKRLEGEAG